MASFETVVDDVPEWDGSGPPPDGYTYRNTTTPVLREFLRTLGGERRTFLEIGCNVGFTIAAIAPEFARVVGVDIDRAFLDEARKNLARFRNVELVEGTSADVPRDAYDVVFIDAGHLYDEVERDFDAVLERNTLAEFDAVFHDYGLVYGQVREFVLELFDDVQLVGDFGDWNPVGLAATDGPEAAWVRVRRDRLRNVARTGRDMSGRPILGPLDRHQPNR